MSNCSINTPIFFEPNSIRLRIFSSRILLVFFQTELDSVRNFFLGLNIVFCFQTESNSVRKILLNFVRFFSKPNWNRFGNGHCLKCSCSADQYWRMPMCRALVRFLFVPSISPVVPNGSPLCPLLHDHLPSSPPVLHCSQGAFAIIPWTINLSKH